MKLKPLTHSDQAKETLDDKVGYQEINERHVMVSLRRYHQDKYRSNGRDPQEAAVHAWNKKINYATNPKHDYDSSPGHIALMNLDNILKKYQQIKTSILGCSRY